jgi:hypothetical protein
LNIEHETRQWKAGRTSIWFDQPVLTRVSLRFSESSIMQHWVPSIFKGMIIAFALGSVAMLRMSL